MTLGERIAASIGQTGPITVAEFMTLCLHDPLAGYYSVSPRLGERGDFITAPHISQMFGELLGLWAADVWRRLGGPLIRLVELGPGDGTMMADCLRAARAAPGFVEACEVSLVETSSPLRDAQSERLAGAPVAISWWNRWDEVPVDRPLIVLANEFLDCLPIRQTVCDHGRSCERYVGVDARATLAFVAADGGSADGPQIKEWSPALKDFGGRLGRTIAQTGGAALFIDYGGESASGDTLQAVRNHCRESPFANPGLADLTAHVDFTAFLDAAKLNGAQVTDLKDQGFFLRALGIEARADALRQANPGRSDLVGRQLGRLIGRDQMGSLFKVACVHEPGFTPPGFT